MIIVSINKGSGQMPIWALTRENLTFLHANKDADQHAHSQVHSLARAFAILYLENIVVTLAPCKISIF